MTSTLGTTGIRSGEGTVGPADDRPLTDQEYQLLQRLLSDPFSFPVVFKTWLISYLETSDLTLPISSIAGLSALLGISGAGAGTLGLLPAGIILPYGGDIAPVGSLMCDGASYLRVNQARLFTAIGTRYGSADANSFNVPDYRDRAPYGMGTNALTNALGKNEGSPAGARSGPSHHHHLTIGVGVGGSTSGVGGHTHGYVTTVTHTFQQGTAGSLVNVMDAYQGGASTDSAGDHSHSVSASGTVDGDTGGGGPANYGCFEVCNFIIVN